MKLVNNINPNMFREYDIRGIYGEDLNEDVAYTIGRSYGTYIKKFESTQAIVGHDNRVSSPVLTNALIKGITESGINVIDIGLVTTPMFYFSRIYFKTPTGIMITASHNPSEYNGFKISFNRIGNAYGEYIKEFYEFTSALVFDTSSGVVLAKDIKNAYLQQIKKSVSLGRKKIRCIIDLGNGTSSVIVKKVMEELNLDCDILNEKKDLTIPTEYLDPSVKDKMKQLSLEVVKGKYDIGIGLDGDADRVGIVDELGNIISADQYMIIMLRYLNKSLKKRKALFDVKCSKSLIDELEKLQIEPVMYRTGNSYINMKMQKDDFDFGGEYSGHLFFRDKWLGFDDGLYAGLRMIEILTNVNEPLSRLLNNVNHYYATDEIKFKVDDEIKFKVIESIKTFAINNHYEVIDIDGVRITFNHFWILVRASNTGPNITVRVEADNLEVLNKVVEKATNDLNNVINHYK